MKIEKTALQQILAARPCLMEQIYYNMAERNVKGDAILTEAKAA